MQRSCFFVFFFWFWFCVFHSLQHDVQCHRWVWVWKRRLHQLHPDVWRHGPLQGQVRWEAVLLRWVVLMLGFFLSFFFQLSCSRARYSFDFYNWALLPFSSFSANRVCKKGYRRCVNGRCVPHTAWCNGKDDCEDNSDETFCNSELRLLSFCEQ